MFQACLRVVLICGGLSAVLFAGCGKSPPAVKTKPNKAVQKNPAKNPPPTSGNPSPPAVVEQQPTLPDQPATVPTVPPAPTGPVTYTIEPIEIPPETAPDVAFQKMMSHYGRNRVVRIVLKFTDGAAPPQTSDWLRRSVAVWETAGIAQSVYVTQQGATVTAIVGPVRKTSQVHDVIPSAVKGANLDVATRTLTADMQAAHVPPAAGSAEETAELAKLVETLVNESDYFKRQAASDRLRSFHSPAAAAAFFNSVCTGLEAGKSGAMMDSISFGRYSPFMEPVILEWLPVGKEKGYLAKVTMISALGEFGGPKSQEALPKLAAALPSNAADLQAAVAAIEKRSAAQKQVENQARLDEESPHPAPVSPDVKLTATARYLMDQYQENQGKVNEKFAGQQVEVTSELQSLGYGINGEVTVYLVTNDNMHSLNAKLQGKYHARNVAPGQRITVKGNLDSSFFLSLKEGQIVKAEGTPPIEKTAEAIGTAFADPAQQQVIAGRLVGRWLVITGKILEVEGNGSFLKLETNQSPKVYLSLDPTDEQKKELKVGQTVTVLGKFERWDGSLVKFENCVLCAPPQ